MKRVGFVSCWFPERGLGYGFIHEINREDNTVTRVFLHATNVITAKKPFKGAFCRFNVEMRSKGPVAIHVEVFDNREDMVRADAIDSLVFSTGSAANLAGEVLILSAEDDPENTLAPRLEAAGAIRSKVHLLQSVMMTNKAGQNIGGERIAQLDQDIQVIMQVLQRNPHIRLIIIDPISSFLGNASMYKEQEVRQVLMPLVARARAANVTVIQIVHFNKNSDTKSAMDRVGGAKAFVGLGRSAWTCIREPKSEESLPAGGIDQGDRILFLKLKGNLAPSRTGGLVYKIRTREVEVMDDETGKAVNEDVPYIQFLEDTASTAQEVVIDGKHGVGRPKKSADCEQWLKLHLASTNGYDTVSRIMLVGEDEGFSDRTLRRTKELVGLSERWIDGVKHWGYQANLPVGQNAERDPENHGGPRPGAGRKRRTVDMEAGAPRAT